MNTKILDHKDLLDLFNREYHNIYLDHKGCNLLMLDV